MRDVTHAFRTWPNTSPTRQIRWSPSRPRRHARRVGQHRRGHRRPGTEQDLPRLHQQAVDALENETPMCREPAGALAGLPGQEVAGADELAVVAHLLVLPGQERGCGWRPSCGRVRLRHRSGARVSPAPRRAAGDPGQVRRLVHRRPHGGPRDLLLQPGEPVLVARLGLLVELRWRVPGEPHVRDVHARLTEQYPQVVQAPGVGHQRGCGRVGERPASPRPMPSEAPAISRPASAARGRVPSSARLVAGGDLLGEDPGDARRGPGRVCPRRDVPPNWMRRPASGNDAVVSVNFQRVFLMCSAKRVFLISPRQEKAS